MPYIDRSSLADAVESYLKLPIRNRSIDRMLVDALVAAEVIAYAKETLHVPTHSAWWKMLEAKTETFGPLGRRRSRR